MWNQIEGTIIHKKHFFKIKMQNQKFPILVSEFQFPQNPSNLVISVSSFPIVII